MRLRYTDKAAEDIELAFAWYEELIGLNIRGHYAGNLYSY